MNDANILVERHPSWVEVVLNRPHRKNAVTGPLVGELRAALRAVAEEPGTPVVVLRGASGAFCSGLDLKEFNADPQPEWVPGFQGQWAALHRDLYSFPGFIVGALEGFAINAGAALAFACDFLVVAEDSFLHVGELRMGRQAPINIAWLYLRGGRRAITEVALRAERIPGPDLARMGLAHAVVPGPEVLDCARSLAARLAEITPAAIAEMKQSLRRLEAADGVADPFAIALGVPGSSAREGS